MSSMLDSENRLAAMDLSSPAALRDKTSAELQAAHLTGYEAMRKIREDAAQFRRDYSNWRRAARAAPRAGPQEVRQQDREQPAAGAQPAHGAPERAQVAAADPREPRGPGRREERLAQGAGGAPTPTAFLAHVGVGGFHRSHQAYMTDVLLERAGTGTRPGAYDDARRRRSDSVPPSSEDEVWGIIGVGLMPWDRKMYETLKSQDFLYTLVTRGNSGSAARVVQSISDFLFVPEDPAGALERLCAPDIRIISLTVTEKGYYRDASGHLDAGNATVKEDIENWNAGGAVGLAQPKTAFGLICTVLVRRWRSNLGPLTVMSCDNQGSTRERHSQLQRLLSRPFSTRDNLPMNGSVCRNATLEFANLVDKILGTWIADHVPFPSSMVDRITPVTKPEHVALLEDECGARDGWPVIAEPFLQWVIEDRFACGRPRWEEAASGGNESVMFVDDVEPYELMKLRLLNSSHSAMAYVSLLAEHVFVDEALVDIDVLTFLRAYMSEVVESLVPVAGVDFIEYRAKLIERFSNAYIKDTLMRLAEDGSQKFRSTLEHALVGHFKLRDPSSFDVLALAFAAFMRCCARDPCAELAEDELRLERYDRAHVFPTPQIAVRDPLLATLEPLATGVLDACVDEHLANQMCDVDASDALRASGEAKTTAFLAAIFGSGVGDFVTLAASVHRHFESLVFLGVKHKLASYRHEQLLTIKAEIAQTYKTLRELQRQEILLTPPEEAHATTVSLTS
ncbi:mannitol 2-dehydrogenase [Aureococcus anophagefferens]|nr:mannitol 2-dehydrogenase [Aureococcus anophagefferens]